MELVVLTMTEEDNGLVLEEYKPSEETKKREERE